MRAGFRRVADAALRRTHQSAEGTAPTAGATGSTATASAAGTGSTGGTGPAAGTTPAAGGAAGPTTRTKPATGSAAGSAARTTPTADTAGAATTAPATGGTPTAGDTAPAGERDLPPGPASRRLREKVVAVLLVFGVLWGYAVFLTGRDAAEVLAVRALDERLSRPVDTLILALQAERRLTMVELGEPGRHRDALTEQRNRTDEAVRTLRESAPPTGTPVAIRNRATRLADRLDGVPPLRADVDAGRLDRAGVATAYDRIIAAGFAVHDARWAVPASGPTSRAGSLVALARAAELLSREDALVSGALAANRFTDAEHARLVELVAAARFARTEAVTGLADAERTRYERLAAGPVFTGLRTAEEALLGADRAAPTPPLRLAQWQTAVEPALTELRALVTAGFRGVTPSATPGLAGVVTRIGLVGGLGLAVLVAVAVLSLRGAGQVAGQLAGLHTGHDELIGKLAAQRARIDRLTGQVDQLTAHRRRWAAQREHLVAQVARQQERAERATERAEQVAARLAAQRRTRELLVRLNRENQTLLHRQIGLLDAMERRETDTDELAELFRLDHLATRVRRNVEAMVSLTGGTPGRRWRQPVPLVDVVRGAVAEVSDYPRVLVAPNWPGTVAGRALPDLIHVLAEIIEAALAASPPTTTVRVTGEPRAEGRAIVVTDDGAGRSPSELATLNALIRDTPTTGPLTGSTGMYVVGRLARRHGIVVELTPGARGGTAATVLVPASLLVEAPGSDPLAPRVAEPAGGAAHPGPATTPLATRTPQPNPGGDPAAPTTDHSTIDNSPERPPSEPAHPDSESIGRNDRPAPFDRDLARPGHPDGGAPAIVAPPVLPVRDRRPEPPIDTGPGDPSHDGAAGRRAEPDWSATIELPVTLPPAIEDRRNAQREDDR